MQIIRRHGASLVTLYVAFIFIQSLFFKFTNAPETQHIFGTLNAWVTGLGLPGLFAPNGVFSQYVIGSAELVASGLLLAALWTRLRGLRVFGALLGLGIMSGAIAFHLFTPLGVVVAGDGGLLFAMACGVWLSCAYLAWSSRGHVFTGSAAAVA